MKEKSTHTEGNILDFARDLLESRAPERVRARLEELKGLVAPMSPTRRARYARLWGEAAGHTALEALEGRTLDPISQIAFQALEDLEDEAARLPFLLPAVEPAEQTDWETLAVIADHVNSADTPETFQAAVNVFLDTIGILDGAFEQTLYCAFGIRLMEDKVLTETLASHTSSALSLWDSLRQAPSEALAIPLLWYDGEEGLFRSAAPEALVSLDTPEELREVIVIYEDAIRSVPAQERILCQQELCRSILRRAGVWLMEQGLDKEPLFRLFTRTIRQYLWGDLALLSWEKKRDNLIPPLVLRLTAALDDRKAPVPQVLSRLMKLCVGVAMDYEDPDLAWMLEGGASV